MSPDVARVFLPRPESTGLRTNVRADADRASRDGEHQRYAIRVGPRNALSCKEWNLVARHGRSPLWPVVWLLDLPQCGNGQKPTESATHEGVRT